MDRTVMYFVIFKPQPGEIKRAYSVLTKEHLDEAVTQGIVDKSLVIAYKQIYTPEDIEQCLSQFSE